MATVTDDDDDWHIILGKRKKETVQYFRETDHQLDLALLCCLTVPLDCLVQYLSSQGLSDCTG
jgi:hypothetical protein